MTVFMVLSGKLMAFKNRALTFMDVCRMEMYSNSTATVILAQKIC